MSEDKRFQTEWTFDFGQVGDRIAQAIGADDESLQPKTSQFNAELGNASSAAIELDFSLGKVTLGASSSSEELFFADVTYLGELEFSVSGELDKKIVLQQKKVINVSGFMHGLKHLFGKANKVDNLRWDVRLSPAIPLDLDIEGGVGQTNLDLSALKIRRLSLETGVGEAHVTLPAMPETYPVRLQGGVGPAHVTVADNAKIDLHLSIGVGPFNLTMGKNTEVKLRVDSGVGATKLTLGENTQGEITIEGGIGAFTLELPEDVATRVTAAAGIGSISIPTRFTRGTDGYDTPGYSVAQQRLTVRYNGGVGSFTVR